MLMAVGGAVAGREKGHCQGRDVRFAERAPAGGVFPAASGLLAANFLPYGSLYFILNIHTLILKYQDKGLSSPDM
jgi:hypothetical protein